jgi:hypothetical protein
MFLFLLANAEECGVDIQTDMVMVYVANRVVGCNYSHRCDPSSHSCNDLLVSDKIIQSTD